MSKWTIFLFSMILSCLASTIAFGDGNDEKPVSTILAEYYKDSSKAPDIEGAFSKLSSSVKAEREKAGSFLHDLAAQSLKDELSGDAPWQLTPFWGNNRVNPARELREKIAEHLKDAPDFGEALPVIKWFLEEEKLPGLQVMAMTGLQKITGNEADTLILETIKKKHDNSSVLVMAIETAEKRGLNVQAEVLAELCMHHRTNIRNAARKLNAKLKFPKPDAFDEASAVQSKHIRHLMEMVDNMIIDPIPPSAKFVSVSYHKINGTIIKDIKIEGWVIKETKTEYVIVSPFGWAETCSKQASDKSFARVKEIPITSIVRRVAGLRKKGDPDFKLYEGGRFTGQFQGHVASIYEIYLAHWLYKSKQYELAAKIFLPALDTLYTDKNFVELACQRLGQVYGYRMLRAFVGDRDYDGALKTAVFIKAKLKHSMFYYYASGLAEQLPERRNDFTEFKLPTPEEWQKMKKKMARDEQIKFLCERIRLMNCYQWGQPGGVALAEQQYAEPRGMSRNAAWWASEGKTCLINPLIELIGNKSGWKSMAQSEGMNLTIKDIPLIAPYLKDDWFILAVSFWRDFSSARHLKRSREVYEIIINGLAGYDICSAELMQNMSDKDRTAHINKIIKWANDNADKTEADILMERIRQNLLQDKKWHKVRRQAERLVEIKEKKAIPLLLEFLDLKSTDDYEIEEILNCCRRLDPQAAKTAAKKYLNYKRFGIKNECAIILLKTGEQEIARKTLEYILSNGDDSNFSSNDFAAGLIALLEDGAPESLDIVKKMLDGVRIARIDSYCRKEVIKKCIEIRNPEGYKFYLNLLGPDAEKIGERRYMSSISVADDFANEIIELFNEDPEISEIQKKLDKKSVAKIPAVQNWLKRKINEQENK